MSLSSSIKAGAAYVELYTQDNKLVRGLNSAAKKLEAFGSGIRTIGLRLSTLGTAMVAPLMGAAKVFADMGSDLVDMSQRTGISVEALSELGFVAEQSGADLEILEGSVKKMQKLLFEAASGSDGAQKSLSSLGLSVADLSQLSPDEQFKRIADRLSMIADPAIRTATAMGIFGKSGTKLLPMLQNGAQGIEELQQQARDLGLTMSTEDASAAEAFGDKIDVLWKIIKKVTFAIGSALEPTLSSAIDVLARVSKTTIDWIGRNKTLVVTVFKVAVAIAAGGAALIAFGAAASAIGTGLAVAAAIIAGIGQAFAVIGVSIAALLTPLGLTIVGVGALAAYLLYATGAGSKALEWLRDRFSELKDTALSAWQGIGDAMAAGDLALAGKILWLTLKMEWQRGIHYLESKWLDFRGFFIGVFQSAVFSISRFMTDAWASLQIAWLETTHFMADSWTILISLLQKGWNRFGGFFEKVWVRIKSLFGDTNAEEEIARINAEIAQQDKRIDDSQNQTIGGRENARNQQRNQIELERQGAQQALDAMQSQEVSGLAAAQQQALRQSEAELAAARQEWQDALAQAAKNRAEASPNSLEKLKGPEMPTLGGLDQLMADTQRKVDIVGTFSAVTAGGLGADNLSERTAKATEQIAQNTKRLLVKAQQGGLTFG